MHATKIALPAEKSVRQKTNVGKKGTGRVVGMGLSLVTGKNERALKRNNRQLLDIVIGSVRASVKERVFRRHRATIHLLEPGA